LIGSRLYVSTKTGPNIAFAVNQAERLSENPTEANLNAGIQIRKYLKSTNDCSNRYIEKKILRADGEIKRRSTLGYIFVLGNSLIMEINYSEKCSLINYRSRIFNFNKMYKTSYMDKKISKWIIQ